MIYDILFAMLEFRFFRRNKNVVHLSMDDLLEKLPQILKWAETRNIDVEFNLQGKFCFSSKRDALAFKICFT